MYSYDEHAEDNSLPNILRQSINLIAELPTMMVNATRSSAASMTGPACTSTCPPRARARRSIF